MPSSACGDPARTRQMRRLAQRRARKRAKQGGWRKSQSASVRRASRRRPARSGCGHLHRGDPAIHCGSQHVPPALRRTTGDGGDVRHRRGSPTCSPASTTPPWDGSSAPCSIGPTPVGRPPTTCVGSNAKASSFGHRDSTATNSHHRQTRRLVHQHLRTAQGPGLAALDPRLPPELVRRSPLAVAWRQFDRALDNFINEAPPPHNPQLGLVVNFTPTKRS
jgi:hypothetical protein